jgi:hypothetical protein
VALNLAILREKQEQEQEVLQGKTKRKIKNNMTTKI